jgi:predicted ArsR family transcriptional regulator
MAEVESLDDGSFLLIENHCPICTAAQACTGLCARELEVFQTVLGKDVAIERSEHILSGSRRCVYLVSN